MGAYARTCGVCFESNPPVCHLVLRLRGGMHHEISGRRDNEELSDDDRSVSFTKVTTNAVLMRDNSCVDARHVLC